MKTTREPQNWHQSHPPKRTQELEEISDVADFPPDLFRSLFIRFVPLQCGQEGSSVRCSEAIQP